MYCTSCSGREVQTCGRKNKEHLQWFFPAFWASWHVGFNFSNEEGRNLYFVQLALQIQRAVCVKQSDSLDAPTVGQLHSKEKIQVECIQAQKQKVSLQASALTKGEVL